MPLLRSWLASANHPAGQFPLNNLPYGVVSVGEGPSHCGVAIGDKVLVLAAIEAAGLLRLPGGPYLAEPAWNALTRSYSSGSFSCTQRNLEAVKLPGELSRCESATSGPRA